MKNRIQRTQQLIYIIHICRQMELLADHRRFVHGLVDTTVLLLERSPLDHTRSDAGVGRVFDSVCLAKQRRHLDTQVKLFDRLTDTFLTVADMLVNKSKCFHGNSRRIFLSRVLVFCSHTLKRHLIISFVDHTFNSPPTPQLFINISVSYSACLLFTFCIHYICL